MDLIIVRIRLIAVQVGFIFCQHQLVIINNGLLHPQCGSLIEFGTHVLCFFENSILEM